MSSMRSRVLTTFKAIHRARQQVFSGDSDALIAGRNRINEEFRKNISVADTSAIEELVKSAENVTLYLKQSVVQARLNAATGNYVPRLTKDTTLDDNAKYTCGEKKSASEQFAGCGQKDQSTT